MKYRNVHIGNKIVRATSKEKAVVIEKHPYVDLIDVQWMKTGKVELRLRPTDFDLEKRPVNGIR